MSETLSVTGVILAGGASQRMGQDKAHLPWGDRTLIEHIIDTLRPVTDEIIVVAKDAAPLSYLNARVVEDLVLGAHALGGLYTGLRLASHTACFACACDNPFLNPQLVSFLCGQLDGFDLVIPKTDRGLQPLHAVYSRSALPTIEEQLYLHRWNLQGLVSRLRAKVIEPDVLQRFDPMCFSFFNLNTPEDYVVARKTDEHFTPRTLA